MLREVAAGHTVGMRVPEQAAGVRLPTQVVPVVDRVEPGADPAGTVTPPQVPQQRTAGGTTAPAAPVRRGGKRRVLTVLAVVLVLVAAGGGGYYLSHRHKAAVVDPGPDPVPGPGQGPAPAGYVWKDDPAGFRFLLPTDGNWVRSETGAQIYYSPDDRDHYLQFAVTVGQPLAPQEHLLQMEASLSKSQKDFQTSTLAAARINDQEGAVWEFSFTGTTGVRRHAKEVEFRRSDGTSFAVYVSGPEKDWTQSLRRFTTVLNSFAPTK